METSCFDTYLEQGTRLECSKKKQEELDQEEAQKMTKHVAVPSGRVSAPDGMKVAPDEGNSVPSGIHYLAIKFKTVQGKSIH